jgi:hypothetical protein
LKTGSVKVANITLLGGAIRATESGENRW